MEYTIRVLIALALSIAAALLPRPLWAGGEDAVLVVFNVNSPRSLRLADFYAKWHNLRPGQTCSLRTAVVESVSRPVYEREISGGIADCLRRGAAVESTLYVVLTQGIPIRILPTPGSAAAKKTDGASVDSELTLLYAELRPALLPAVIPRAGPSNNPFFRREERAFSHPLFPIYLVTRLAGYSFEDAKKSVERCRGARNRGQAVLDSNADNDELGNDWLRRTATLLAKERVLIDTSPGVLGGARDVIAYAGWGSNDRRRRSRKSGMDWLAGSIAAEYVSTSARTLAMPPLNWTLGRWGAPATYFAGSPQSLILDYVWEGVSGIAGFIDEPYLAYTIHPDVLFPAYLSGRNLAESFYLAMPVLSWQSMVIGDPLCKLE